MSSEPIQPAGPGEPPQPAATNSPTPFEASLRTVVEGVVVNLVSAGAIYLAAVAGGLLRSSPLTVIVIAIFGLAMIWELARHVALPLLGRPLTFEKVVALVVGLAAMLAFLLYVLGIIG